MRSYVAALFLTCFWPPAEATQFQTLMANLEAKVQQDQDKVLTQLEQETLEYMSQDSNLYVRYEPEINENHPWCDVIYGGGDVEILYILEYQATLKQWRPITGKTKDTTFWYVAQ